MNWLSVVEFMPKFLINTMGFISVVHNSCVPASCTLWYNRILIFVNDFITEEHQLSALDNFTLKHLKTSALHFDLIPDSQGTDY
jgi:hypothetical protein